MLWDRWRKDGSRGGRKGERGRSKNFARNFTPTPSIPVVSGTDFNSVSNCRGQSKNSNEFLTPTPKPPTYRSRHTAGARWRLPSALLWVFVALTSLFAAIPAYADLDTITLTRVGANKTTVSVSNNHGSDLHYSFIAYALANSSTDSCTGLSYSSSSEFNARDQTYSNTITGNAGKYVCLRGYYQDPDTNTYLDVAYSTPQGPLGYSGPTLTLNSAGADGRYVTGDNIDITAAFGYNVDVDTTSGTPRIGLTIGSNTRYATYNSGTGSGNLVFRYTVVAADVDSDGISVAANALALNSGTIQDSGNTDAVITHAAVAARARTTRSTRSRPTPRRPSAATPPSPT